MPCNDYFDLTLNRNPVPGVPNPSPFYELGVYISGHPQKAPKGWKIPACYFDLASLASSVGTLNVTTTATTATFTDVTNNVTTVINVPTLPNSPSKGGIVDISAEPPISTQFIGGGTILLTEPMGWLPVTIGGVAYAAPLYPVKTP